MPELPEVETVRRTLNKLVTGKKIRRVKVGWPNIVKNPVEHEQFEDALVGQTIHDLGRRGKFLVFQLDDYALVSHLRMEGNYRLQNRDEPTDKHIHVVFEFGDGTELRYRDVRKFGTMHLFAKGTEDSVLPLAKLGPEPFSAVFTEEYLKSRLGKTSRVIKAALLDQTIVAGLGNIYVDEVLFKSKIHPERVANSLSDQEISELWTQSVSTLQEAIEAGGSSVNTYMNSDGLSGTYQERLNVYGRKGEECRECGTLLEKIKTAGRGTHFCPECQRQK